MLSELCHYVSQDPKPDDVDNVQQSMQYLEARNKLFKNGFLTHKRIFDLNLCLQKNIYQGFDSFSKWHDELKGQCDRNEAC